MNADYEKHPLLVEDNCVKLLHAYLIGHNVDRYAAFCTKCFSSVYWTIM